MIDRRRLLSGSLAAAGPVALSGKVLAQERSVSAATGAALDSIVAKAKTAGGFVAGARNGELQTFYSWGRASLPFDVHFTPQTLFHVGSTGKQFTGVAVQQLVQAGRVRLSDPLGRHVRGLPPPVGAVEVRHLLHQTSGLPDYLDENFEWDRPLSWEAVLNAVSIKPALFRPGEAWAYSNTNYLLLGRLISEVTGRSYGDYLREYVFKAAGLPSARIDAAGAAITGRADPYHVEDDGFRHAERMDDSVSSLPDGPALFSASDLPPWQTAMEATKLLSRSSIVTMRSAAELSTGRSAPYGFGLYLDRTRGQPFQWHSGYVPGFPSYWMSFPRFSLSVLACTNSDGPDAVNLPAMALEVAESLAPGSTFASLPAGNPNDLRAKRLRAFLFRGDTRPSDGLLAPELTALNPASLNSASGAVDRMTPVEAYRVPGGEMVRYRIEAPGLVRHRLAGWTPDGKLFWIGH